MQDVPEAEEQRRARELARGHRERRAVRAALQDRLVRERDDRYREQAYDYCCCHPAALRWLSRIGAIIGDGSVRHLM